LAPLPERFLHRYVGFLGPGRRDGQRRPVGHPHFDTATLFVPQAAAADPALAPMFGRLQRAWWRLKCQHFDTVLLVKIGGRYELYHMDAEVGRTRPALPFPPHPALLYLTTGLHCNPGVPYGGTAAGSARRMK
jgi:hypothetical protein